MFLGFRGDGVKGFYFLFIFFFGFSEKGMMANYLACESNLLMYVAHEPKSTKSDYV